MAINSSAEPVLYVDNVLFIPSGETVGDRLYSMSSSMVDHVEVTSMANSQMGANGSFGAIWVFTKRIPEDKFKSLPILIARGFDRPHAFQLPPLVKDLTGNSSLDLRSTCIGTLK